MAIREDNGNQIEITQEKVNGALKALQNRKPGVYHNIPNELLTCGEQDLAIELMMLFQKMFDTGTNLPQGKNAVQSQSLRRERRKKPPTIEE